MSNATFKSKFGFHPCDYDTYRKLKTIHKWYYQTLHDYARWERWDRKEPQNRVIRQWVRDEKGNKVGRTIIGPQPEPQFFYPLWHDCSWVGDYQRARMPKPEKEVSSLQHTVDQINQFYFRLKDWVVAQGRTL